MATETRKEPVSVELVYNRVVPIDEAHFRIVIDKARGVVELTRRDSGMTPGESVDQIRGHNSVFAKYLQGIDPAKQYLVVLLNNDSFAAFRAVEQLTRDRGSPCGVAWVPYDSKDGRIVSRINGQRPREQQ